MDCLLEVDDLIIDFDSENGSFRAVDGVCLRVPNGEVVAVVGESGCGKSVTAMSLLGLLPSPPARVSAGRALFRSARNGAAINLLAGGGARTARGRHIAVIFQDPMTALNPVMTVGQQIGESLELHRSLKARPARIRVVELLREVGIAAPERRVDEYPHQLSGGMRQRVMIAMALAAEPELLIADEPTTALDATVQSQILDLLAEVQRRRGMSMLLITHDLGVVARLARDVYVMYAGRIVEHAALSRLLAAPRHPYTQALLSCLPELGRRSERLPSIGGQVPHPAAMPSGCPFHPRCELTRRRAEVAGRASTQVASGRPAVQDSGAAVLRRCVERIAEEPSGTPKLSEVAERHFVACWEA